ncbi:arsenic resistance N-acetyltransferase ArsN2 [Haloterrigena alkaliphila]|uniref:GNAT family N-acetyltransferase n=1 Tax=Haloterrigena alkaliphila TaxID=2816475 RepID=A0A8A2VKF7_9EURY|nr:arsenic resistance N-acetyltransferase ArsN2 [Haloterrigena alkaliphila]QSX00803.1 arsenic resistance N-acetyltransferase ArsN2 [Haloterrigena alkaliphila]
MDDATVTLRRADESALEDVETLLAENDLPSADVRTSSARFYVGFDGDERVGIGGLERYGTDGLLRSVVVERSVRGNGYGTALCDALERRARADGLETLYLLTTTAAGFFAGRGCEELERSDAPAAIRETTQFDELCPASATCMRTSLRNQS